jgi:predicted acylesterase/phospholipase RssA
VGAQIGALFAYFAAKCPIVPHEQEAALENVKTVLAAEPLANLLDLTWFALLHRGIIRGNAFEEWLTEHTLDTNRHVESIRFEHLTFDLHVTGTEASTGRPLLFNKTNAPSTTVSRAVRASISIPLVFWDSTADYGGQTLTCWDGGTTGNCRFDIAQSLHPERLTIGSSVTYRGEGRTLAANRIVALVRPLRVIDHLLNIALRSFEEQTNDLIGRLAPAIAQQIIVVRPSFLGVNTFNFRLTPTQREELYANGHSATSAALRAHGVLS